MAAPSQPSAQQLAAQNISMRQALLASAPRMRKNVQTVVAAIGSTQRLKLFNVGVLTKLQLRVQCDVTIAVAIAVPSGKAPYNLISRIRLTDYDNTDRLNISGFQLFLFNCVRSLDWYGYQNAAGDSATFVNPQVPTAVGAGSIIFFMDIPVAYDVDNPVIQLQDLRGAILSQTAVGEMYLSVDFNASLYANNDVESVYAGAGTTTVVGQSATPITMTMWQEYLLPQAIGSNGMVPLPMVDLMTVYEFVGNVRSSDNLAVNTEKLVSYPNVRSVIGAYFNYVSAGVLANALINQFRLIANGNNILVDHTNASQLFYQRKMLQMADLPNGCYFRSHKEKPIETALLGNVQMGITPNTVGATPYLELGFESFYTKGAALPGIGQAQ